MGTHFSFLFSIYSENHGVQAEPLNFARSPDITYVHSILILLKDLDLNDGFAKYQLLKALGRTYKVKWGYHQLIAYELQIYNQGFFSTLFRKVHTT